MMEQAVARKLYGYGVWDAPFLVEGNLPAIMAVDSFGVIRKIRPLKATDDREALGERLWDWLLEHHPERQLALVREPPPARRAPRTVDPRLLADPRSPLAKRAYINRLVERAAGAAPVRLRDSH
jgi:hypothetical protein